MEIKNPPLKKGWYFSINGMNGNGYGPYKTKKIALEQFRNKILEPLYDNWMRNKEYGTVCENTKIIQWMGTDFDWKNVWNVRGLENYYERCERYESH